VEVGAEAEATVEETGEATAEETAEETGEAEAEATVGRGGAQRNPAKADLLLQMKRVEAGAGQKTVPGMKTGPRMKEEEAKRREADKDLALQKKEAGADQTTEQRTLREEATMEMEDQHQEHQRRRKEAGAGAGPMKHQGRKKDTNQEVQQEAEVRESKIETGYMLSCKS